MSEKKFTPGPWNFHDGWAFYRVNGEYFHFRVGENANSNLVKYDEQWEANAALISAAPELLEALEELLEKSGIVAVLTPNDNDYTRARAAINKAYGK